MSADMLGAALGIVMGLTIGGACRWFDIPLPAPPKSVGAFLVLAMTLGFLGAELVIERMTM
jgi:XapX domain-containing protein